MACCQENLLKWKQSGLESQKEKLSTRSLIIFFTEIDPCMLPVEVWSLIVSYLSVIDLFNLSVCSKYFYVIAHKNTCLNKKINISKHLISKHLIFFIEKFIQMKLPYIFITVEFFLSINIVLQENMKILGCCSMSMLITIYLVSVLP